jgi:phosphopantothenoylcysteine decarboxylase/phosphopantothenate--cysteine ligase
MHPAERLRGSKSRKLDAKVIVLGITGSIAAVKCVELIRELIRHGAEVHPVMSDAAEGIVHANSIEFAAGRKPVTRLDGQVPYIEMFGRGGRADLLLIAPATSNTVSKMATGVDDTAVTTYAQNALGSGKPILIAPAMHETMYDQPIVQQNVVRLKSLGVEFLEPRMEEDKAKLADIESIVTHVIRRLGPRDLGGKRVVVVAGGTVEPIDDMRVVTNRSSGAMGIELARVAFERGGDVELWLGRHEVIPPPWIQTRPFETTADLLGMVGHLEADYCLVPAAISDYAPRRRQGKVPSSAGRLTLELDPTPKVVDAMRKRLAGTLVAFKAESGVTRKELLARARDRLRKSRLDFIVANDLGKVTRTATSLTVLGKRGAARDFSGPKPQAAEFVWEAILRAR